MTQSSIQHITLAAGETRELVFINEPNTHWHIVQEENSSLRVHIIYLSENEQNAEWQSTLTVEQNAPHCRTEIYAMGLLHQSQQAHLLTRVYHNIGGGYSSQVLKFVLDDHAKGSFRGELKIQPNAQQTEAYQTNRNILLSRQAEMLTEPQLEIYMQQRCIDRDTAAKLLLCAFFNEVIETLTDTQLQEELVEKINRIL